MSQAPLAISVVALLVGLGANSAHAQDRQLRTPETAGLSLQRYCQAQLGRSDLSDVDLEHCQEQLYGELAMFDAVEPAVEPLAKHVEATDNFSDPDVESAFELDEPVGRVGRAYKKTSGTDDDEFDFEDDEEPDAEDEFGFDFEFEGQEEPDDPIETFDFDPMDDPDDDPLGELDGIPEKQTPKPASSPTGSASSAPLPGITLDVVGKTPLGDNYEPVIVAYDRDSVVVELPVLLGRSRADFDGIAYCIVAEVFADGNKVSEARQQVTSASLAEFGPSFAFIKMLAPVTAKSGKLEVRLSKASNMSAQPTQLFSRSVGYQLP